MINRAYRQIVFRIGDDEDRALARPGDLFRKGDPEGDLEEKALYGNQGGGDGAFLDMPNWKWETAPNVEDPSNERGQIRFRVYIDAKGVVQRVEKISSTLSPKVEILYQQAIYELTFTPSDPNANPEEGAEGIITWKIRSN